MRMKSIAVISILCLLAGCKDSEPEYQVPEKPISDTYIYKLPVIFHILYSNPNDAKQYVKENRMAQILAACNELYKNQRGANSADMNLEFVLATQDGNGRTLAEPGVERILWDTPVMDCENFMQTNNETNVKLLWDPNKYINVMLYTFTKNNILGISHLPYSLTSSYLNGLNKINYDLQFSNLKYPYCVSINNTYIDKQGDSKVYYTTDIVNTLAHELGHYLGLHHAFSESEEGNKTDLCHDSDYCDDTPTYNRFEYDRYLLNYVSQRPDGLNADDFKALIQRNDCNNRTFISRNVMDYSFCRSDQFTGNQRSRIRHVLLHSPFIPGPKEARTSTRSLSGPIDLPIRTLQ